MLTVLLLFFCFCFTAAPASAGPYLNSAHGGATGVKRVSIGFPCDYTTGNCAHCHEQHASIDGGEPTPEKPGPSAFALFSDNFDASKLLAPYNVIDNFCFYCHSGAGSLQSGGGITNYSYARTFGNYGNLNPSGILEAFNQTAVSGEGSNHNLYDIWRFSVDRAASDSNWSFFKSSSNPCVACHNPHMAKRDKASPADPTYTAISRPVKHNEVWGDDPGETLKDYADKFGGVYRPPYMYGSTSTYEPAGSDMHDGSKVPDYNTFCLDCHKYQVPTKRPINHTRVAGYIDPPPPGYLAAIKWGSDGDIHGGRPRRHPVDYDPDHWGTIQAPFNVAPVQPNYVLSCLDCHEPHGTEMLGGGQVKGTSYLLRKEVNNNEVDVIGGGMNEMDFCLSCHTRNHCGGPRGCLQCHYHSAWAKATSGWCGPSTAGPVF